MSSVWTTSWTHNPKLGLFAAVAVTMATFALLDRYIDLPVRRILHQELIYAAPAVLTAAMLLAPIRFWPWFAISPMLGLFVAMPKIVQIGFGFDDYLDCLSAVAVYSLLGTRPFDPGSPRQFATFALASFVGIMGIEFAILMTGKLFHVHEQFGRLFAFASSNRSLDHFVIDQISGYLSIIALTPALLTIRFRKIRSVSWQKILLAMLLLSIFVGLTALALNGGIIGPLVGAMATATIVTFFFEFAGAAACVLVTAVMMSLWPFIDPGLRDVLRADSYQVLKFQGYLALLCFVTVTMGGELKRRAELQIALVAAREKAEFIANAKSRILVDMSHDIRSPLTSLTLNSGMLQSLKDLTSDQRRIAESISAGGEAVINLLNQVLDQSKLEGGSMLLRPRMFNLRALLVGTADYLSVQAQEKGLELTVSIHPDCPDEVCLDRVRVQQVLTNLATNAIKFTDKGRVSIIAESTTSNVLKLLVCDTGPGIPEAYQPFLFNRHVSYDQAQTDTPRSWGLGLSIAKSLVELMGGQIGYISVVGAGTTFWFAVPIGRELENI